MQGYIRDLKISFNSPIILGFFLICLAALILNKVTGGWTNTTFFSVYRSSFLQPLTYVRMIGHIFGHANWNHFLGNMTLLLVVGPLLEEKYGSEKLILVIIATALVTGIINIVFFPHVQLLGASGVVFAFILLSSITSMEEGKIPMTFLLVSIIYIGGQVYDGIFIKDNVANLTHVVGGIVGVVFGYILNR